MAAPPISLEDRRGLDLDQVLGHVTQNLRMLERTGLVERTVHPTVPPRVEYTLTEPGEALRKTVDGMCDRTLRYLGDIEASRNRFDA